MKLEQIKVGQAYCDSWWPWVTLIAVKVLKTRVRFDSGGKIVTYDKAHLQFISPLT